MRVIRGWAGILLWQVNGSIVEGARALPRIARQTMKSTRRASGDFLGMVWDVHTSGLSMKSTAGL